MALPLTSPDPQAGFANTGDFLEVQPPDMVRLQAAVTELQVQLLYL